MKKLILLATMAVAAVSFGKGYIQEWNPKLSSWESVVYSCKKPVPYKLAAADDFIIDWELPVSNINWWGVVSSRDQLFRPYYIAVYKEGGKCRPSDSLVWSDCIKPYEVQRVGEDCKGNLVWKFFSNVNPWNPLVVGPGHYWLQISESDQDSSKVDAVDFWWSSHQEVIKCPALQFDQFGNVNQPLFDPCNDKPDDLAFELY